MSPTATGQGDGHECSKCGKRFRRKSDLGRHERTHTGEKPHPCDHPGCQKRFAQKSALMTHKNTHTGAKPHSSSRSRHFRHKHMGRDRWNCDFCGQSFARKEAWRRHCDKVHVHGLTGESPNAPAPMLDLSASIAVTPEDRAPPTPNFQAAPLLPPPAHYMPNPLNGNGYGMLLPATQQPAYGQYPPTRPAPPLMGPYSHAPVPERMGPSPMPMPMPQVQFQGQFQLPLPQPSQPPFAPAYCMVQPAAAQPFRGAASGHSQATWDNFEWMSKVIDDDFAHYNVVQDGSVQDVGHNVSAWGYPPIHPPPGAGPWV